MKRNLITAKSMVNRLNACYRLQVCNPSCVESIPSTSWTQSCNLSTRDGGISRLTFLVCDPDMIFPNSGGWLNPLNVTWAICTGLLYVTGGVLGQKPKGTFTKRRLSSCSPEVTISGSKTITFQDFNADTTDLLDFNFWDAIVNNKRFMSFGYITCDGRWYQYSGAWDIELDEVIEDTLDGKSFYDGIITMATKDLLIPIITPGLLDAISNFNQADCNY